MTFTQIILSHLAGSVIAIAIGFVFGMIRHRWRRPRGAMIRPVTWESIINLIVDGCDCGCGHRLAYCRETKTLNITPTAEEPTP